MRIGRIGSYGTTPYVSQVRSAGRPPVNDTEKQQKKLPGWQGKDSFTSTLANSADGRVTATGGSDYLMSAAANAARFDENFNL